MKRGLIFLVFVFGIVFSLGFILAVTPYGASSINVVSSTSAPADSPVSVAAVAGNVTEINVFGYSTTQTWQGYYGNVSGTIQLADGSDNVLYNWSLANPEGEIFASTSNSVDWSSIDCFDWSIEGEALENSFGISYDDLDGVNETFSYSNNHDLFYVNSVQFNEGQCMSTMLYDNSGQGIDNHFEEVLLWDGSDVVFTSLLEEAEVLGFDGRDHDFEMIVLEDGHDTDVGTTDYFFYVELQ